MVRDGALSNESPQVLRRVPRDLTGLLEVEQRLLSGPQGVLQVLGTDFNDLGGAVICEAVTEELRFLAPLPSQRMKVFAVVHRCVGVSDVNEEGQGTPEGARLPLLLLYEPTHFTAGQLWLVLYRL